MYQVDIKSWMSYIPAILVFIGAAVAAINSFTNAVELPPAYAQAGYTVVAILIAAAVFFTNLEKTTPLE